MNLRHLAITGLGVLVVAACTKPTTEAQPVPSAASPRLTDEALDRAQVPVKEDFEEQALQAVTEETLDEQVSQLEKQIEEDK